MNRFIARICRTKTASSGSPDAVEDAAANWLVRRRAGLSGDEEALFRA